MPYHGLWSHSLRGRLKSSFFFNSSHLKIQSSSTETIICTGLASHVIQGRSIIVRCRASETPYVSGISGQYDSSEENRFTFLSTNVTLGIPYRETLKDYRAHISLHDQGHAVPRDIIRCDHRKTLCCTGTVLDAVFIRPVPVSGSISIVNIAQNFFLFDCRRTIV